MRRLSQTGRTAPTASTPNADPAPAGSRPVAGNVVRSAGRVLLWALLGLVLVRGVGSILTNRPTAQAPESDRSSRRSQTWPTEEARAFAARFATAYLSFSPKQPETHQRQVAAYLADDLSDQAAATLPAHGPGVRVALATVAREVPLGGSRARFTVATTSTTGTVRYLTVPVVRDQHGGLSVIGLPSLAPAPAKSSTTFEDPAPLSGPDAPAIEDLARRFLSAYLAGHGASTLRYFLAPGARVTQMPTGLRILRVGRLARDPNQAGHRSGVAVSVQVTVRDTDSGAIYPLAYHLRVVHRDRWYVHAIDEGTGA